MSEDRTCRMSDLRRVEHEVGGRISQAERLARMAGSSAESLERAQREMQREYAGISGELGRVGQTLDAQRGRLRQIEDWTATLRNQQDADRARIAHNEAATRTIRADLGALRISVQHTQDDVRRLGNSLVVLQEDTAKAKKRIEANEQHIRTLGEDVGKIHAQLDAEAAQRVQVRQQRAQDVEAQKKLAEEMDCAVSLTRVERFGCATQHHLAKRKLQHAAQTYAQGNLFVQTARGQYQDAQLAFEELEATLDQRETEFDAARRQFVCALERLDAQMALVDAPAMEYWLLEPYLRVRGQQGALSRALTNKEYERAGQHSEVVAALQALTKEADKTSADVEKLRDELDATIMKGERRLQQVGAIVATLEEMWGQSDIPTSVGYARKGDPRSDLRLQTARLGAPNVTVYAALEGGIQFSWTGYEGMECSKDADEMALKLKEKQKLEVTVTAYEEHPGRPNPPFDGGTGTMQPPIPVNPPIPSGGESVTG